MFDGLFMLLALSALMALASFLAGSLPLSLSLSPSQLKVVTTLGMGVLAGTALIVIIPEGAETLYSANEVGHVSARRLAVRSSIPLDLQRHDAPRIAARAQDAFPQLHVHDAVKGRTVRGRNDIEEIAAINALPGPVLPAGLQPDPTKDDPNPPKTPIDPGTVGVLDTSSSSETVTPAERADPETHHAWMGISLVLGFILMYLIDTLPALRPPSPPQRMNIYSLSDLGSSQSSAPPGGSVSHSSFPTTLGLVIHAVADGIALGASSTQPSLSFIIFFAIMVHKAPAAFGLTSVLLKQGLSKRQARTHLLVFSLAAPAGAVFAWLLIGILGGGGEGAAAMRSTKWWTGIILLFSGGTFLYVAMHTMQENNVAAPDEQSNGYLDVPSHRDRLKPAKSLRLVLVAVAGMLLPLITQVGHAH